MGDRVARVENGATSSLTLICAHHLRLYFDAAANEMGERIELSQTEHRRLFLHPLEVRLVRNEAVLHRFGESRAVCSFREGSQGAWVGDDGRGRMKGSYEILALGRVHTGLASDRRVQHGKQRRWNL